MKLKNPQAELDYREMPRKQASRERERKKPYDERIEIKTDKDGNFKTNPGFASSVAGREASFERPINTKRSSAR